MRVPQRGRAILRRIAPHDAARGFRPGDFLLTTSDGGLAKLQGWVTGCPLNHAGLIIDVLGTVVEADPCVMRGRNARAIRIASVGDYLRAGRPCWIGYVELREGTRSEVVGYAEHLLRAQRGRGTRFWLTLQVLLGIAPRALAGRVARLRGLHHWLREHALALREEHTFLSGELVARALERGGFIWGGDAANVTPADLFSGFHHLDALPEPLPFRGRRRSHSSAAISGVETRGANISELAPRRTRGANALREDPREADAPQAGIQALARVGVLMAAGLAMIGLVEETIRLVSREG
jgi:hypothetical protein